MTLAVADRNDRLTTARTPQLGTHCLASYIAKRHVLIVDTRGTLYDVVIRLSAYARKEKATVAVLLNLESGHTREPIT